MAWLNIIASISCRVRNLGGVLLLDRPNGPSGDSIQRGRWSLSSRITVTKQTSRQASVWNFVKLFTGVGSVGFLTHTAEYSSFIIVLAYMSDKLTVTFQLGSIGYLFVGSISGIFLVTSGLISVPMGHLCDKYGRRNLTIFGGTLGAVSMGSLIVANQFTDLIQFLAAITISLCALGVAHGTYTASTLSYSGDLAEKYEQMGKAYGLVDGAEFAGFAFGPALGTTIAFLTKSRIAVFETAAALMLLSAVIAVFLMPEVEGASYRIAKRGAPTVKVGEDLDSLSYDHTRNEVHSHSASWGDYVRAFKTPIVGVALLTTIDGAIGFAGFFQFVPLYANALRASVPVFGLLYGYFASIMALSSILIMVPLGHVEDKGKRRMPYLVAGLIGSSVSIAAVFFNSTIPTFIIASLAHGLFIAMIRVSQLVILAEHTNPSNRAAIMGTNHAMEHAGYGIASITVGVLVGLFGFVNAFRTLAFILFLGGLAFLAYARRKKLK
jgi:MFS family permease